MAKKNHLLLLTDWSQHEGKVQQWNERQANDRHYIFDYTYFLSFIPWRSSYEQNIGFLLFFIVNWLNMLKQLKNNKSIAKRSCANEQKLPIVFISDSCIYSENLYSSICVYVLCRNIKMIIFLLLFYPCAESKKNSYLSFSFMIHGCPNSVKNIENATMV